jgi:Tfp pilus assembly protein FimV
MTDTEATDSDRQQTTAQRGAWLDKPTAAKLLDVSEKTIERRVKAGQIQQRTLPGNRVRFWIANAELSETSEDTDTIGPDERDGSEQALALGGPVGLALVDAIRQELAESRQRIEDLSRQNGQLQAELDQLRNAQPRLSESTDSDVTPAGRPWWRRWWGGE